MKKLIIISIIVFTALVTYSCDNKVTKPDTPTIVRPELFTDAYATIGGTFPNTPLLETSGPIDFSEEEISTADLGVFDKDGIGTPFSDLTIYAMKVSMCTLFNSEVGQNIFLKNILEKITVEEVSITSTNPLTINDDTKLSDIKTGTSGQITTVEIAITPKLKSNVEMSNNDPVPTKTYTMTFTASA